MNKDFKYREKRGFGKKNEVWLFGAQKDGSLQQNQA